MTPTSTLHHGDALAILRDLPAGTIDLVAADPPYSSGGRTAGERTRQTTGAKYVNTTTKLRRPDFVGDNRDQRGYLAWSQLWLSEALRAAKPGAIAAVFADWRQLPITTDALQAGGWTWRGIVVWDKGPGARPYSPNGGFSPQAEYIVWGTNGPLAKTINLPGVLHHAVRQSDKHHQTGKPTDLMRTLVRICPTGGTVLDPFAGSGTTGVACQLENRNFIGCELVPAYVDIATHRLQEATASP